MFLNDNKIIIAADIFPPEVGGPATYSVKLAELLIKNGFNVKLICYSDVSVKDDYCFSVVRIRKTRLKIWNYIKYFFRLLFLSLDSKLIYAQGPVNAGFPAWLVAKILHKKLVIKVVGDYAWEQFRNVNKESNIDIDSFQKNNYSGKIGFLKKIESLVCRRADRVITPSDYLRNLVIGWGVINSKVITIYNYFVSPNLPDREQARKELGFKDSDFIIVSIGRAVPWKGFGLLYLTVQELIKTKGWPLKLRLLGINSNELRDFIKIEDSQSIIDETNLSSEAVGKKTKEDVYKYLVAADIFILNTGYEGLSHAILEAMSCGVAVITTNVCGNPELVKNGVNGILIEYNNRYQLKSAIEILYKNQDLRQRFSRESIKLLENFSKEKIESSTLELLGKIME